MHGNGSNCDKQTASIPCHQLKPNVVVCVGKVFLTEVGLPSASCDQPPVIPTLSHSAGSLMPSSIVPQFSCRNLVGVNLRVRSDLLNLFDWVSLFELVVVINSDWFLILVGHMTVALLIT